jgi:hypothetical protein
VRHGDGERRWVEAGRPVVPSLAVDGRVWPILHVSQIAEALGLPPPPAGPLRHEAEEAAVILRAWIDRLRGLEWSVMLAPTPARGRSLRNLTVNIFHPFELLPGAWDSAEFAWHPENDGEIEDALADRGQVLGFAETAAAGWRRFLSECRLDADPHIVTPRGGVPFSTLVAFQRWHAVYHYRQLLAVLGRDDAFGLPPLEGVSLPSDVF